ncbi:transferrin-binding protein-like solute binding protein [Aggregatibacter kilianii]|uniref:transferrin-binding protein-like solute binding protein n=1 Tax=Aggregatibacter kilianii TaxID=2025884 RepID=UPI000D64CFAD|nr:transferrin-binding protein-like solute binding protein [Aggregatibacter kilianii]
MKNNKLVKFSLTLICSAVLAACGSSGGGDDSAAKAAAEQQAQQQAAQQQAAQEAAAKAAAEKAAADKAAQTTTRESNPGYLLSKREKSDFIVNTVNADKTDSTQSKPLAMTVQDLDPRLDTIVVAYPHDGAESKAIAYVEDFQFVGNTAQNGTFTLTGVYDDSTERNTTNGVSRAETRTKTNTRGTESGTALVYEKDRVKYFDRADLNNRVEGKDTLAEVYGLRTNSREATNGNLEDNNANNLPLVKETNKLASKQDGQLRFVQYGRVTTKLHNLTENDLNVFKKGLLDDQNSNVTSNVIGFAHYGEEGTENSYFYRGLNNTTGAELAKLSGELEYHGHAVAYGLDNNYRGVVEAKKTDAPNAIGVVKEADPTLKSGYHVIAKVNLDNKNVTGSIYNTWSDNKNTDFDVNLVNFNGKLDNYGNIAGNSELAYDSANKAGSFNATLFGSQATELGGNVAGNKNADTTVTQWGAVFGAKAYVTDPVVTQEPIRNKPWAARADENTAGQVK